MNDTELTDEERETLVDWWESDWPDTRAGAIGTLFAAVGRIVAARVAAARADALAPVLAHLAEMTDRIEERRADAKRIGPDDRQAWVHFTAGLSEARDLLRAAVADPEPQPPNTCPSCALGQHRCTRGLAPCDCRECA